MINRHKRPHGAKRDRQHQRRWRKARRHHEGARPHEEGHHQKAPPEAIRKPAHGQGANSVNHEHGGAECKDGPVIPTEKLGILLHHGEHGGRQDQQAVMGETMRGIDQNHLPPCRIHAPIPRAMYRS